MTKLKIKPRARPAPPAPASPNLAAVPTDLLLSELGRRQVTRADRPLATLRPLQRFRCLPGGTNREGTLLETHSGCCCKVMVAGEAGKERLEYWSEAAAVIPTGEYASPPRQEIAEDRQARAARSEERRTEVLSRKEARALAEHATAMLPQVAAPKTKTRVEL